VRLVQLLAAAGFDVALPNISVPDHKLFFTNAVLCLKSGTMRQSVSPTCFKSCGEAFLRPLVGLISPRAIATLGARALEAVLRIDGATPPRTLIFLLDEGWTFKLRSGVTVFPFVHPMASRPKAKQLQDWRRLERWFRGEV
jgi:uracil-DNA glycosylase